MVIAELLFNETPDWKLQASAEYTRERNEVLGVLRKIAEEHERLKQKAKPYEARLVELDTGAKVFGFKVLEDQAKPLTEETQSPDYPFKGSSLFKDAALQVLREAYPNPLKASQIRSKVEIALNRKFHEKTAGMTLYRLSKEGAVRREGHRWFFVPARDPDPVSQEKEPQLADQSTEQKEITVL